jgi:putative hydrolase of the HAD superfamily
VKLPKLTCFPDTSVALVQKLLFKLPYTQFVCDIMVIGTLCGRGRALSRLSATRSIRFDATKVRVISLDVTGTLLLHKQAVAKTYSDCIVWAGLPRPEIDVVKKAFKEAYYNTLQRYPCFGHSTGTSGRDWWRIMAEDFLQRAGYKVTEAQANRFFTKLYQHYGSQAGYEVLPDASDLLTWVRDYNNSALEGQRYSLGVITNTDHRTIDSILPMMGLHHDFDWFLCCHDVGAEKPEQAIFEAAHEAARFSVPDLKREEILHIGDNFATDFCGARAAGLQALFVGKVHSVRCHCGVLANWFSYHAMCRADRSNNDRITTYQEWLKAPDYPEKSEADVADHTITSLREVVLRLQVGRP